MDQESARSEIEGLIETLERIGDDEGVASAWLQLGTVLWVLGSSRAATEAYTRALLYSDRTGDRRVSRNVLSSLAWVTAFGSIPAEEGIRRLEEIRMAPGAGALVEANALCCGALLKAKQGRFEEARSAIAAGRLMLRELGLVLNWAGTSSLAADIELLAGEPTVAERELREAYGTLERLGETGYLSGTVTRLAEAVFAQGRLEEALELAEAGERVSVRDDIGVQSEWRNVRARVLARQGDAAEAERLARESVALCEPTDYLDWQALSYLALADVLLHTGRPTEAIPALEVALRFSEQSGDVVSAGRTRAFLEEVRERVSRHA